MSEDSDDDYEVGYKRPPKHHRFKKGQASPNPKGRPKKRSETTDQIYRRLGDEKVDITISGRPAKISAKEAVILAQRNRAIKGDHKAQAAFTSQLQRIEEADRKRQFQSVQQTVIRRVIVSPNNLNHPSVSPGSTPSETGNDHSSSNDSGAARTSMPKS